MFYVGQKVVCVDDVPVMGGWHPESQSPVEGEIYTITAFGEESPDSMMRYQAHVWLAEIRNAFDIGYLARRFRPLTDISTLQSIVAEVKAGKPRKIKADRFDSEDRRVGEEIYGRRV